MTLRQPGGDDPNHAGVLPVAREDERRELGRISRELGQRGLGALDDIGLRCAALSIRAAELLGDLRGALGVGRQ